MTSTTTLRAFLIAATAAVVLLAALLIAGITGGPSKANAAPASGFTDSSGAANGVTVTGTGKATGTPDKLTLDMGVMASRSSVSEAMSAANEAMSKVVAALKDKGVSSKDITSSALSVQPEYNYPDNKQPVITGYVVSQGIVATLRDLGKAGEIIGAATDAGGNATQINSIGLDIDDPDGILGDARTAAIANAKAKAETYAQAVGRKLGQATVVSEVSTPTEVAYSYPSAARDAMASGSVPIQPGSQNLSVTVTVSFAWA